MHSKTSNHPCPTRPSLAPHPESEIEWWHLHGRLDDGRFLVVYVWRYRGDIDTADGLSAAYALTHPETGERRQTTWIDAAFLRQIRTVVTEVLSRHDDPYLDAFLRETTGNRLFAPFTLTRESRLTADGRVQVGPIRLAPRDDGGVKVDVCDEDLLLTLTLEPGTPGFPMGDSGHFSIAGKPMSGYTFPRLQARGAVTVSGVHVPARGDFWFDHQWGPWSFRHVKKYFYHPEWLYVAVNLDDGRSLAALLSRQRGSQPAPPRSCTYAIGMEASGAYRSLGLVATEPQSRWESLRTNNLYEFGWHLSARDTGLQLELTPLHADPEIYVFTKQRGLLEVPCHVEGQWGGQPCRGWGFVEAFGDTLDVNEFFWGQEKSHLADQLERFLPRTYDGDWLRRNCGLTKPPRIDAGAFERGILQPLWSMMDRGGKGWRSAWFTTCYFALGGHEISAEVRSLLPVTELLHTGSLIIDDIQDGSAQRRGRPALHHEIGSDLAINVGCYCYFLPLEIVDRIAGLSDRQRARIHSIISTALRQGHVGQAMDLMWSKGRFDLAEKLDDRDGVRVQLIEQYRLKSGCQLEAIARIGATLLEAPTEWTESIAEYSWRFGVVFQIIDDLIDVQEAQARLGKEEGEDLRNGKLNIVLLFALSALAPQARRWWLERLPGHKRMPTLDELRVAMAETDAAERCLRLAEGLMDEADGLLDVLPATDARLVMRSAPRWLIEQRRRRERHLCRHRLSSAG